MNRVVKVGGGSKTISILRSIANNGLKFCDYATKAVMIVGVASLGCCAIADVLVIKNRKKFLKNEGGK